MKRWEKKKKKSELNTTPTPPRRRIIHRSNPYGYRHIQLLDSLLGHRPSPANICWSLRTGQPSTHKSVKKTRL